MEKTMKKATKKSFEKHLCNYLESLNEEEKKIVAKGLWHVWRASEIYNNSHYGNVKRHRDISDLALIAYNNVIY